MEADCSSAGPTWLNLKLSVALAVATVALVALGTEYLRLRQEHKALEAKHKALRNESHSASNAKHKAEQQRFKADACAQVRGLQLELDKAKLQARLDVLAQVLTAEGQDDEDDNQRLTLARRLSDADSSFSPADFLQSGDAGDEEHSGDEEEQAHVDDEANLPEPGSPYVEFRSPSPPSPRPSLPESMPRDLDSPQPTAKTGATLTQRLSRQSESPPSEVDMLGEAKT